MTIQQAIFLVLFGLLLSVLAFFIGLSISQPVHAAPGLEEATINTDQKIRVQKTADGLVTDWGDPKNGRPQFRAKGLKIFGHDKDVLLGFRSDGQLVWKVADKIEQKPPGKEKTTGIDGTH